VSDELAVEGVVVGVALGWLGVAEGAGGALGVFAGVDAGVLGGVIVGDAEASGLDDVADFSSQPRMNKLAAAAAAETRRGVFMPRNLDVLGGRVFS
jgi:hypothetical protein